MLPRNVSWVVPLRPISSGHGTSAIRPHPEHVALRCSGGRKKKPPEPDGIGGFRSRCANRTREKGIGGLSGWLALNTGTRFAKKCHVHKSACRPSLDLP